MTVETLLARLDKARQTGPGRWIACCPAHQDKSPSLAVRELQDGRVLLHCFAGCAVDSILAAVGLEMSDLFPDKPLNLYEKRPRQQGFAPMDVLQAVVFETLVVDAAVGAIQRYGQLTEAETDRLALASDRLQSAVALVEVRNG